MSPSLWQRLLSWAPLSAALLAGCSTLAPVQEPVVAQATAPAASAPAPAASAPAADAVEATAAAAAVEAAVNAPVEAEAPKPVDPLRPESIVDLNDVAAQADLWARLRRGFAMPELDTDLVRTAEGWYATRPDYVQRMTERGSRYLFHIVEEVERRGMPTELALLPFVESAFNPQAMSTAKASGMWQFMPGTGRDFALKQNVFRDDRRDVLASTRAALDYLGRLYASLGDWHLALAAYNWGEGNVRRAIARNQRAGRPTDYLSLRMPNETQYYVPKLQAVKNIINRPESYGLALSPVSNHPHFLSVPITRDIDVDVAARLAGMPEDDFKALNPQMNKPVILAAGTPYVLLPYDNANQFVRGIAEHKGPLASWTAWVAPKTLRAGDAAKQVGMSEAQLREVNRIPPRMLVRSGSTLLVPRTAQRSADVSEHIADNAMMSLQPDGPSTRKVSLKAGKKDTVASIARRYRLQSHQVAQWNNVSASASFKPGQTIVVYLAGKATGPRPATSRTRAKTPPLKNAAVKASRPVNPHTQVRPAKVSKAR
ncbi:MAG TPA: transglycosylase SLT domain-containing protein [Albitalea sp.]|uniref:transglycosylase SLT domain-containing protein n=1 Tax=Piscinibacter sp. TaxID=1903157 RepID=UPI002ED293B9